MQSLQSRWQVFFLLVLRNSTECARTYVTAPSIWYGRLAMEVRKYVQNKIDATQAGPALISYRFTEV